MSERESTVQVRSEDMSEEEKKKKDQKDKQPDSLKPDNQQGTLPPNKDGDDAANKEMTEEDRLLKEKLEELVKHVGELLDSGAVDSPQLHNLLDILSVEIQTSTSSMTSVPKPLKFLRPHYDFFKNSHEKLSDGLTKKRFSDILSTLSMTVVSEEPLVLQYRLSGTDGDFGVWGHEYVRHLSGEVGREYSKRVKDERPADDLLQLVSTILPYDMKHNGEAEACDLLLEVDHLDWIKGFVNEDNHSKVCLYLLGFSTYVVDMEELSNILSVTYDIYVACGQYPDALRVAIKMDNPEKMSEVFQQVQDEEIKKQMGFILGSQKLVLPEFQDDDAMMEIIGNYKLHEHYLLLAKDLEVVEAKSPDDIYKNHLADQSRLRSRQAAGGKVDSAKQNLASTFVNAFVNTGFSHDTLMTPENSDWVYKNKDHGKLSAVASLGLICLWDLDSGFSTVDKYTYHNQDDFKAGALLATGLISSGVTSEMDAAFALLAEHVDSSNSQVKIATILGLGFAYAGSRREDVLELLSPLISSLEESFEVSCMAALALGFVFVGQCHDDVSGAILEAFMSRTETDLNSSVAMFLSLGLGLLYVGKGEATEAILEALQVIEHPFRKCVEITVELLAYTGTGNPLTIQKFLKIVGEHIEEEEKGMHQAIAVLGIAAVAMGENLGSQMASRIYDSILQYCEVNVRRAVPLALGLLSISHPQIAIMDTLSKLTHDNDEFVSQNAIFALGLIGAGTNNSRIAQLLRQLAVYYGKEPNHLFLVRIAQGYLYMGKGLLTLNPVHSDGLLLSKISICGLFTTLFGVLTGKNTIFSERHYLLFSIVTAIRPRFLVTLDENLQPLPVSVRVGQAVDVVGQAGRPKTITGFQTQTTPVILNHGNRAELATDEYLPLTNILEGFVILKKNPNATGSNES
eukprot:TRINITY_DN15213_c0_g1_i1.p1 TRINITY_DN15213_c0_g1~~TRINITY_DN15213_c0_g1_i1.p1  ORF type:complete len:911 (-),score=252.54 TRINITY_DN15213_c0_g1_i1:82-2814(-)